MKSLNRRGAILVPPGGYNQLTPRENSLMGKRVTALSKITYYTKTVRKGSKGVICDFGGWNREPLIQWKSIRGFTHWDNLFIEEEEE